MIAALVVSVGGRSTQRVCFKELLSKLIIVGARDTPPRVLHLLDQSVFIVLVGGSVVQRVSHHRALGVQVVDQFVVVDALIALGSGAARLGPLAHVLEVEAQPALKGLLHQQLVLILVRRCLPQRIGHAD